MSERSTWVETEKRRGMCLTKNKETDMDINRRVDNYRLYGYWIKCRECGLWCNSPFPNAEEQADIEELKALEKAMEDFL